MDKKSRKGRRMVPQVNGNEAFGQKGSGQEGRRSTISQATEIYICCGDFADWLRLWNQFKVEVDGSKLPQIIKSNYLL